MGEVNNSLAMDTLVGQVEFSSFGWATNLEEKLNSNSKPRTGDPKAVQHFVQPHSGKSCGDTNTKLYNTLLFPQVS